MPHRPSPSLHGARAARELLLKADRLIKDAASRGEDVDLLQIHALFVDALQDGPHKRGLQLALIQFIVGALEGSVIDLRSWQPLANPDQADSPIARRRY